MILRRRLVSSHGSSEIGKEVSEQHEVAGISSKAVEVIENHPR